MNSTVVIICIIFLLAFVFLIYRKTPSHVTKVYVQRQLPPKQKSPRWRQGVPDSKVNWKFGPGAPPLPLSTMYAIRIGRKVLSHSGPGDPVWDYDHGTSTGPRY